MMENKVPRKLKNEYQTIESGNSWIIMRSTERDLKTI